ncbi:hypothetical protein JKP75_02800 [Blastococcus sp. TML/M2B]|uniref:hypothetical protein n=1 Tax=unclassified Blastococcus TaxID=2619396 RepID=UPI001909AFFE|nr:MULTISPECIES: hypothetical protein [unclassified Blastococcus]MBN1091597.1 hypothetical protein [Blastococcus sp. TML/M2B]MBN1094851.1 hypothetical protein [Blastococcus sp. TML/C7B]
MPLRSVEAATRDDAIAAAHEQFGPAARVVGVRRIRSGGVLGFFATERYVAEVAPEPAGLPGLPGLPVAAPARPAGALTEDPDTGSLAAYGSPLAAAALATAAPPRARTAPPRNGAAAWAAEAARTGNPAPLAPAPRATPAPVGAGRVPGLADDLRVDELAGLLGLPSQPSAPRPAWSPADEDDEPVSRFGVAPASFPRTTRTRVAPASPAEDEHDDVAPSVVPAAPVAGAPSPFTAALARMVAGDRDVQHAVREALETSDGVRSDAERDVPAPASTSTSAELPVATGQEEETVGDQVIAPPSPSVVERVEVGSWADEPFELPSFETPSFEAPSFESPSFEVEPVLPSFLTEPVATESAAAEPVSREDAIAEVLRAALAEGHSDDALAGILRKVVAGDAPQDVLPEPIAPVEQPVVEEPVAEAEEPTVEQPAVEAEAETEVEVPVAEPAAVPAFHLFGPATPAAPVAPAAPVTSPPVQLWGEVAAPATATPAPVDALMWADAPRTASPAASLPGTPLDAPLPATEAVEVPALFGAAEEVAPAVEELATGQAVAEDSVADEAVAEDPATSLDVEVAPVLARTASDPAPLTPPAAMDATTVLPPLSLLPGSSSRGRGLPPVPPRGGRPPVPPTQARGAGGPSATAAPPRPSSSAGTSESLATVTRLPVAPLMATPETPELSELTGLAGLAALLEADAPGLLDTPVLPAAVPARPARVRIAPPRTPAEVVSRLSALGVPDDLLDAAFLADVEADGTYAALTRALGNRLPEAPELPTGAGDVLFVVGPGIETLRTARSLAATLRLDPDRVQWASRGDLAGLAPEAARMATIDAALRRRQDAATSGTVTVVAVDAPLRTDAYWMTQMLAIWSPVAVWAVVEATRKPEDLEHWLGGLARVDALVVQDTDLSADPAAVLDRVAVPVAVVDGVRATPHRWASVLCERLESAPA